MEPILCFDHFGFKYDVQVEPTLFDIDLKIFPGEKLLIAGPSGCGKSTLAHCINGLIPFSYFGKYTGGLTIRGREARDMGIFERSKVIGTVLQDSDGQFVGLTVAEDIAFALENDAVPTDEMKRRVAQAARSVAVERHLAHAPHELSGGQKQRVSLAGVLVDDVDVLLFDEPLANLDPATGKQAIELIDDIHADTGKTIIIIEHRLEDVLHRDIDRVILMNDGRIVADVTPAALLCSGLLQQSGIREPLYITAMKYAGCTLTPDMHPEHIETVALDDANKQRVRDWFKNTPAAPAKQPPAALLEAKDVTFAYSNGHRALENVNVTIGRGEMMGIVGRNGAGKSTFCKLVCGFETQQQGTLSFDGRDLASESIKERAEHIGYVMQNPNQMISKILIADEIGLGLVLRGKSEAAIAERVAETLKTCGLYPFREWPVSALSYGQKKRVTVGAILALRPEIILLDEPTAGQDFRHYTEIMEFLLELNRAGVTVVMITHDMHLMLEYCDRAVVFSDGHVVADDTPASILTNPGIIERASLKETSLFSLAVRCGVGDPRGFVTRFIDHDREVRRK